MAARIKSSRRFEVSCNRSSPLCMALAKAALDTVQEYGFASFAVCLFFFAVARTPIQAFIVGFFLGIAYFATTTAMMTILQSRLAPNERGRVMALWFMAFGGTIPIGNLIFGPIMDRVGSRPVLLFGAVWALFLAWSCKIEKIDKRDETQSDKA